MFNKLEGVEKRFLELERLMSNPKTVQNQATYQRYVREHADLNQIVTLYRTYRHALNDLEETMELLSEEDPEIKALARAEIEKLDLEKNNLETALKKLLMPKDKNDEKNVIIEIRAGIGGEEAGLFVSDLFRMYSRYAENKNWKVEIINHHATGVGGLKEIIVMIHGKGAYSRLNTKVAPIAFNESRKPKPRAGCIPRLLRSPYCLRLKMLKFISTPVISRSMYFVQPDREGSR